MKIKLNPYRQDGFMFIDKELGVCLALDKPIAVIDDNKITRSIKSALKAKTILEIVENPSDSDEEEDEELGLDAAKEVETLKEKEVETLKEDEVENNENEVSEKPKKTRNTKKK